jgi:hypothetical protein
MHALDGAVLDRAGCARLEDLGHRLRWRSRQELHRPEPGVHVLRFRAGAAGPGSLATTADGGLCGLRRADRGLHRQHDVRRLRPHRTALHAGPAGAVRVVAPQPTRHAKIVRGHSRGRRADLDDLALPAQEDHGYCRRIPRVRPERAGLDGSAAELLAKIDQVHPRGTAARSRYRFNQAAIRAGRDWRERAACRSGQQPAQSGAQCGDTVGDRRRHHPLRHVVQSPHAFRKRTPGGMDRRHHRRAERHQFALQFTSVRFSKDGCLCWASASRADWRSARLENRDAIVRFVL